MQVSGKIKIRQLEGGLQVILKSETGKQYQLVEGAFSLSNGDQVTVEGSLDESQIGVDMCGPRLIVRGVQKLSPSDTREKSHAPEGLTTT